MGLVMGVTAVVLGLAAALVGVIVGTALIFPRPVARARMVLEARPGRCFLIGVLLALLLGVPARALLHEAHGLAKVAGWFLAFPHLTVLVAVGMTAMAQLLGERLRALSPELTPLAGLVRGGVILELALALPFFGWFLVAPVLGLTLLGAGALGVVSRKAITPREARDADRKAEATANQAPVSLVPARAEEASGSAAPDIWRLTPDTTPKAVPQ
jgi:hypothetical protein